LHPEGRWRGLKNKINLNSILLISLRWSAFTFFLCFEKEERQVVVSLYPIFWLGTKALCHSLFDLSCGCVWSFWLQKKLVESSDKPFRLKGVTYGHWSPRT
jgi:hypothetical protein